MHWKVQNHNATSQSQMHKQSWEKEQLLNFSSPCTSIFFFARWPFNQFSFVISYEDRSFKTRDNSGYLETKRRTESYVWIRRRSKNITLTVMWIVLSLIRCAHEVFRFLLQGHSYTHQSWKHSNKNTKKKKLKTEAKTVKTHFL